MPSSDADHWPTEDAQQHSRPPVDLTAILLGGPKLDDDTADVFAEIEAERKADFVRDPFTDR